jgi:predicted nuclease of predicted toxin-antitoxin system
MARTIRFHLDEHVPHAIAEGLRRLGVDVTTTTDAALLGAADADHIAFGLQQGRVIFTEDDDFLVLAAAGDPHEGLVYCQQNTRSIGQIIWALDLIWEIQEAGDMKKPCRVYLMADRVRRLHANWMDAPLV